MRSLKNAVPALVVFGPIIMMIGAETHLTGLIISMVGALMLGVGAGSMYSLLVAQSMEIQRLRTQLEQGARQG